MSIKIVVMGDGISSQLFANFLKYHVNKDYIYLVVEKKQRENEQYIDDVPFYFNSIIDDLRELFVPIKVQMGIYDKGEIIDQVRDDLVNKYAIKTLGFCNNNTIRFIEKEKKAYVVKNENGNLGRKMMLYSELKKRNKKNQYLYDSEVVEINTENQTLYTIHGDKIKYDILISTIPLIDLNRITDQCHWIDNCLNTYPFFINRFLVRGDGKYKVIYCTDDNIRFSRIAKLNETIFLESREEVDLRRITMEECHFIDHVFELDCEPQKSYVSYPGRFQQIDNECYIKIKEEYKKRKIFLLGRMATWRFKLAEDIYDDCKEICKWIF